MNRSPRRNPTLIDGMILIAATAVGFAGCRAEEGDHYHAAGHYLLWQPGREIYGLLNWNGGPPAWFLALYRLARMAPRVAPVVAGVTLALLAIRLRPPRPRLVRLGRQPGFVAEAAVAVVMAATLSLGLVQIGAAALGVSAMADPHFYANANFLTCRALRIGPIGWAVVASWAVLVITRRWRREPGWIDAAGIGIGLAWVGLPACDWFDHAFR